MATRPAGPLVVVGSGLAGLTCALSATTDCLLITAGSLTEAAASMWAQGGIAAAIGSGDSVDLHAEDTWRAGAYAGDRDAIRAITAAAPSVVAHLENLAVPFDRQADGTLDLALEGGHSRHRIAHAGDRSGAAITTAVAAAVRDASHITVLEDHTVTRLLIDAGGRINGIRMRDDSGRELELACERVVLATGGMGGLWPHTTNPRTALGQGVALAARAGARTQDLHLVQFHPTGLDVPRDPMPLLTEALRGAGARLLSDGRRFVDELQPRDVVAAAVWEQLTLERVVHLDARHVPDVAQRFPAVQHLVGESGFDLTQDLLPVRPALHYSMGGVTVDADCRTSVRGLWAVGEVARTGLHGANRLASNSLLEAVVTGQAAAVSSSTTIEDWSTAQVSTPAEARDRHDVTRNVALPSGPALGLGQIRSLVGASCGVLRNGRDLRDCVDALEPHIAADDAAYVAWLVARSALAHPHSIGAHRRTDDTTAQGVPA
ncbi:L-aspartate oxidase [Rudaeicoccus suwonensis]|uniref:L-aspartate oxidase n=1 Tax=Rudaeicoccus suwonensis TaxID=657409 RepID=A0A561E9Q7_9MICO|nr:FAD-binding protein [Rudaeicoccus suwonensis]TWE12354.1 L-aspartate oxidase [Rudaeicoccus suwonensis]